MEAEKGKGRLAGGSVCFPLVLMAAEDTGTTPPMLMRHPGLTETKNAGAVSHQKGTCWHRI